MAAKSRHSGNARAEVAFRNKAGELGDDLKEMAGIAVDLGRERIGKLRSAATENYEGAKDQVMNWENALESYIQERPFKSLIVAALAGMVIAKIWRHR